MKYVHECAPDILIEVLKVYRVKADVSLIKCRVFNRHTLTYYEVTKFRLPDSKCHLWSVLCE